MVCLTHFSVLVHLIDFVISLILKMAENAANIFSNPRGPNKCKFEMLTKMNVK